MDLQNKRVLVTGSTQGIGAATALAFAQKGCQVLLNGRRPELPEEIADQLEKIGADYQYFSADVSDEGAVKQLFKEIGEIDILVNNAGITKDNLLLRMSEEDWDDILNIHLKAVFRLSKRVLKGMTRARFGRIINISSVVAHFANPGQANYSAAKAGIEAFSRSLAKEMGSRQITVNCIAPGFIATEMTEQLNEDIRKKMNDQVALNRFGEPQDIANAVSFLASDKASYITGNVLHVNGGLFMA